MEAAESPESAEAALRELVAVVGRLRAPGGCPWDREQTHRSLRPYVVEEAYEVAGAIDEGDPQRLAEELGDLLLQVILHSAMAAEAGQFNLTDVVRGITEKIVRRHPHVFGNTEANGTEGVRRTWEEIKRQERARAGKPLPDSLLDGVGAHLPALLEAKELQAGAAGVGFDWPSAAEAWPKVEEEIAEFRAAWQSKDLRASEEELGDILFALVNVARLLRFDPEIALKGTNAKFARRFRSLEERVREQGRILEEMTLGEMDHLWEEIKKGEKP